MRQLGPITILHSLILLDAHGEKLESLSPASACGRDAVLSANWLETHGDLATSKSERWTRVSANMWLATSPKR